MTILSIFSLSYLFRVSFSCLIDSFFVLLVIGPGPLVSVSLAPVDFVQSVK